MPDFPVPDFPMFVSVEGARALFAALLPPRPSEQVPLTDAYGRTLAADLPALVSHPTDDDSALDGIACREADTLGASPEQPVRLRLVGEARAGAPYGGAVGPGQAARIYTGAPVPAGADAICPVEQLREDAEGVLLLRPAFPGDVRRAGQDFRAGEVVLRAGQMLTPARVALAAALGYAQVPVHKALRVALLSTGDELTPPGEPLPRGHVYNANVYGLIGALREAGHEPLDLGQVPDRPEALTDALRQAGGADLLLTSGGVSMGNYDFVRDLLMERGTVAYWKVRMRPGGPAICGTWDGLPLFGLPGNPVSALLVFELIVKPALSGQAPRTVRLRAGSAFSAPPDKTVFARGVVRGGEVMAYPKQNSGVLRSLSESGALVVVPEGERVEVGDEVEALLLKG